MDDHGRRPDPDQRADLVLQGPQGPLRLLRRARRRFLGVHARRRTYICTGAGGQTFCQKGPAGSGLDANPAASFGLELQGHPEQFNSSFQGTKSIAGQTAQCYGVKALTGAAFGGVTSCYSSSGVPLLMQMKSPGQEFTMEASSFSTSVTDADFKLPAAAN